MLDDRMHGNVGQSRFAILTCLDPTLSDPMLADKQTSSLADSVISQACMRLQQLVGFVVVTTEDAVDSSGPCSAIDHLADDYRIVTSGKSKTATFQNQHG